MTPLRTAKPRRSGSRWGLPLVAVGVGALGAGVTGSACSSQFDAVSELQTLRVMAVQKDVPYARPGQDVTFSMMWHDSSLDAGRRIERLWVSGCNNPPGDSFQVCLEILREIVDNGAGPLLDQALEDARSTPNAGGRVTFELPAEALIDFGEGAPEGVAVPESALEFTLEIHDDPSELGDFTYSVPSDIVFSRPPPKDPSIPPYGLAFVYFGVCAGEIASAPEGTRGVALVCKDGDESRESEDFIFGYSQLYAYDDFENGNPVVTGARFDGDVLSTSLPAEALCFDPASVRLGSGLQACQPVTNRPSTGGVSTSDGGVDEDPPRRPCSDISAAIPVVEACTRDNTDECAKYEVQIEIDESQAEIDEVQTQIRGETTREQMWVNYYVDAGSVKSDARVLNDATSGWNEQHRTEFTAPKEPGLAFIWVAPHDNRGGTSWARIAVCVE